MRPTRTSFRIAAVAAAALLTTGAVATTAAQAAPKTPDRAAVASLVDRLGSHTAGSYLDHGTQIVTVTTNSAAEQVRSAGLTPKLVKYSMQHLHQITADLAAAKTIPGTAWAIDPSNDRVIVTADSTVSKAELKSLHSVTDQYGSAAHITTVGGKFSTKIAGGDAIYGGGYRCSLGFNVTDGSSAYFLTAGHCGNVADTWYSDSGSSQEVGTTQDSQFPDNDFALVKYADGVDHPSAVDLYNGSSQDITEAADAQVGESVQRSGSTTQVHDGTVKALDATVNYEEGTVNGLIQTDVCAEGGDSGGSLFDGSTALGLTSGGSGDCSSGGETFFQPVPEALDNYGVQIG